MKRDGQVQQEGTGDMGLLYATQGIILTTVVFEHWAVLTPQPWAFSPGTTPCVTFQPPSHIQPQGSYLSATLGFFWFTPGPSCSSNNGLGYLVCKGVSMMV